MEPKRALLLVKTLICSVEDLAKLSRRAHVNLAFRLLTLDGQADLLLLLRVRRRLLLLLLLRLLKFIVFGITSGHFGKECASVEWGNGTTRDD